jgi:hypothetical protein
VTGGREAGHVGTDLSQEHSPRTEPGWAKQVRAAGLSVTTAKRWQTLARVPGPAFRAAIEDAKQTRAEVTLGSFIALGRQHRPVESPPRIVQLPANVTIETADARRLPVPDGSVELFAFSPPFNVGMNYGVDEDGQPIDDALPYEDYLQFARDLLRELHRVGSERARLAINVPLDVRHGGRPRSVAADWANAAVSSSMSASRGLKRSDECDGGAGNTHPTELAR